MRNSAARRISTRSRAVPPRPPAVQTLSDAVLLALSRDADPLVSGWAAAMLRGESAEGMAEIGGAKKPKG
jgi:hypothetical protein